MAISGLILEATLLVLLVSRTNGVSARRHTPLLVEEDGTNRRNRPAECQFGKSFKELGSTWFADLGPPFGVMYCIKCECIPVQKKRRIVARVQCKNIKNECPRLPCDDAVLLPGQCCKTCPGDITNPDIVFDVPPQSGLEEEERNMKHFAALLTGRTSLILKKDDLKTNDLKYSTNNPLNIVATGRFTFHKKNLYYSFYMSDIASRPRAIQFMDHTGTVLEEHNLLVPSSGPYSIYQNSTGKICGVWRRVPRDYRRILRDDQMHVVLLWGGKNQAELALAGPVGKYSALSTELFSALLEPAPGTSPDQMSGAGGTAIVSTSSGATSSIHLTLVINGIFNPDEVTDVPLNIRVESIEKKQIILEDVQRVRKPLHDINVIEISSPVSTYDLRMLMRGRLTITVESRKNPEMLRLQGSVVTRVTCELFQTLLSTHKADSAVQSNGLAWLYLNKDGALIYNIQTSNLSMDENPMLTIIDDSAKRKTELEDLTPSLFKNNAMGTLERLGPRVLEPLYSGDLAINIATQKEPSLIRGKLSSRFVADARDFSTPILLKRLDQSLPSNMVGMAWLSVDNECVVHYDITLTGTPSHYQPLQLYMEEIPLEAPGAPVSRKLLEDFNGNSLEGFSATLTSMELAKLETSVIYLEVRSKDLNEPLMKGTLRPTKVPNTCLPAYLDNDVPSVSFLATEHHDNNLPTVETKCYHSGRFHSDGETWNSDLETCTVCSCDHGKSSCEPVKCPGLAKCRKEDIHHRKGECCPVCMTANAVQETSMSRGCKLGDQFHSAGSSWHPYLPPNGYDTCAVITCDIETLEVRYSRTKCPPLACPDKVAYRPDKKACCKVCPQVKHDPKSNSSTDELRDSTVRTGTISSPEMILKNGGCKSPIGVHENGQEWHPIIASVGEQKCVKCKCKDGHMTCSRLKCPKQPCRSSPKKNGLLGNQQSNKLDEECCQCVRQRRHHVNHKRKQQQQQQQQQQHRSREPEYQRS